MREEAGLARGHLASGASGPLSLTMRREERAVNQRVSVLPGVFALPSEREF